MLEERVTTLSTTEEIFYPEVSYCRGIYDSKFKRNMFKTRQCVFSSWKSSKFIYYLRARSMAKRFKHRLRTT